MPKRRRQPPPQKLKRQKRETPKLRLNACQEFLKYSTSDHFESPYTTNFMLRYSLINEKFRKEVKQIDEIEMELPVLLADVNSSGSDEATNFFSIKCDKTKDRLDAILELLKMVEYSSVEFQFEKYYYTMTEFNKELIENFAYFCRKLKDVETLKKISVDLATYDKISRSTTFIFSSLLPKNKLIYMNTVCDVSSILRKHETPVESLTINDLSFDECTAHMFKSNTKELFFSAKHCSTTIIPKLHNLRVVGPFSPNPTLELLGINVDLMFSEFGPNIEESELEKIKKPLWNSEFLPNHRKSFEYLKQINDKLELQLEANESESINDNRSSIPFYKEQLQRAKAIIDMAQEFGFKIRDFQINTVFSLPFGVSETQMAEKFTKSTKMKVSKREDEDDGNINLIEYNGVPIKLKVLFPRRVQICCMRAARIVIRDD